MVQLSSVLQAVLAQQLLPRADGSGRVLATEVLVTSPAVRTHIRERKEHLDEQFPSETATRLAHPRL